MSSDPDNILLFYQGTTAKSEVTKRKLPAIPRGPFSYSALAALEVAADFHVANWLIFSNFLLLSQIQLFLSHICNFWVVFCYLLFFFYQFDDNTHKYDFDTYIFVFCSKVEING